MEHLIDNKREIHQKKEQFLFFLFLFFILARETPTPTMECPSCREDDFYYESKFSESGDIGWKCLFCHQAIKDPKLIEILENSKLKEKVSCIVMDLQGCGTLVHEDSSYDELNEKVLEVCVAAKAKEEEFIIQTIFGISQTESSAV